MKILRVTTHTNEYPIYISKDLSFSDLLADFVKNRQVAIISNDTVSEIYLNYIIEHIKHDVNDIVSIIVLDGEKYKNLETISHIYDQLMDNKFNRDSLIIALGGGVVGDMAGFAAASYQRGIDYIQIPTTLLSQVDSSVGGKTGVNHVLGKNMIGAFKQPQAVLIETKMLETLPKREVSAGIAEIIKYAIINDYEFFCWLETNMKDLVSLENDTLNEAIYRSCEHKANIVAEDEFESGKRALLNFGHTFGHAIENHMGYGTFLHGEAVAIGMIQATYMSLLLGNIELPDFKRVLNLIKSAKLPSEVPEITSEQFIELMSRDKKIQSGSIRFVLLNKIGDAFITSDYSKTTLQEVLTVKSFDYL